MNKIIIILIVMSGIGHFAQAAKINLSDRFSVDGFYTQNQIVQKQVNIRTHEFRGAGIFPVDIPDNDSAGVAIEIDTTGSFTGKIESLTIELEIEHTWVGDLSATLIAPNGIAQLLLLSRIGRTPDQNIGFGSNLIGTYTFNDQATEDIWTTAAVNNATTSSNLPVGQYRTSTTGTNLSRFGGCSTRLNGAFKGLTANQTNGIWTLNISDNADGETGQVLSVGLLINQDNSNLDAIFKSSFEVEEVEYATMQLLPASDTLGDCKKAQFDFSGNGLSDYSVAYISDVQDLVFQFTQNTGNGMSSEVGTVILSPTLLNPVLTSGGDFDGDGITDIVVRVDEPGLAYIYLIRRSSRPNDLWIKLRTSLDLYDPQFGDYDGDGLSDLAWFSAPETTVGNAYFFIYNSSDFQTRQYLTGMGVRSDFRAAGGFEHNGDGIDDIFLIVNDGLGIGDGNQLAKIYDGTNGNLLLDSGTARYFDGVRQLPGHFLDGNRAGIGIFHGNSIGDYTYGIGDDSDASFPTISNARFGVNPTDTPVTGDYDGDGIDDFGVWRPDTDGMGIRFIIRPSGNADPDNNLIEASPAGAIGIEIPIGGVRVR